MNSKSHAAFFTKGKCTKNEVVWTMEQFVLLTFCGHKNPVKTKSAILMNSPKCQCSSFNFVQSFSIILYSPLRIQRISL